MIQPPFTLIQPPQANRADWLLVGGSDKAAIEPKHISVEKPFDLSAVRFPRFADGNL